MGALALDNHELGQFTRPVTGVTPPAAIMPVESAARRSRLEARGATGRRRRQVDPDVQTNDPRGPGADDRFARRRNLIFDITRFMEQERVS
jgi:hypothetical protein